MGNNNNITAEHMLKVARSLLGCNHASGVREPTEDGVDRHGGAKDACKRLRNLLHWAKRGRCPSAYSIALVFVDVETVRIRCNFAWCGTLRTHW